MNLPTSSQPVTELGPAKTALFTRPWYLFFRDLAPSRAAPAAITVGASAFSYSAQESGIVIVSGGTVVTIELGRNGTFVDTGIISGIVPVSAFDVVRVTYSVLPSMTFVRR